MYKQILAPATGTAGDAAVFATALLVARAFGAHLQFLHAKVDVTEVIVAMSAGGAGGTVQSVVDQLEADTKAQEQKAFAGFAAFCADAGLSPGGAAADGVAADMTVETGNEAQWLTAHGRFADLVVVGRTRDSTEVAMDVMQAVVMDTGSPVLLAPAIAPTVLAETVVIAWKDTPQAARAVAAAMPFIDRARRVVILCGTEPDAEDDGTAHQLQRWLHWHNAETSVQTLPIGDRSAVEVLLEAAHSLDAGLLVMGGYSHSQWREAVFGGATQHVLRGADLPVLMAH